VAALGFLSRLRLIRRSLFLQVMLNYHTMQGPGFLFALWPWLKRSKFRSNRARLVAGFLNSHPVFSVFAMGAVLRRLRDGDAESNATEFDKWRESLASPLGLVGDSLIWERWKPLVFASGAGLMLLISDASVWPLIAVGCMIFYNGPLFALRYWALGESHRLGREVLALSAHPELPRLRRALTLLSAIAAGIAVAGAATRVAGGGLQMMQFAGAFVVVILGRQLRLPFALSILLALLLSLGLGLLAH